MSGKSRATEKSDQALLSERKSDSGALEIVIMSFGYKQGPPPGSNILFDVRFLKNPFWVEELRALTGLDRPVQEYVLEQDLAQDFLRMLGGMLDKVLPRMAEMKVEKFVIAFGCTGGQHRSTTLVEALAERLSKSHPQYKITKMHRELDRHDEFPDDTDSSGAEAKS